MSIQSDESQKIATLRQRLLTRIHRRFVTTTQTHLVGPLRPQFTRVADPDVVLDQIVDAEDRREKLTGQRRDGDDLHLPYWAELWDSALGIGAYLTTQDLRTRNVLDLGCGMGFAGMIAAMMGANVLLADLEADALLFARLNTLRVANRRLVRRPELRKRYFGYRRWQNSVRIRKLNWQKDRLDETFDLIIGADVLYDRSQWEFLEPFFRSHCAPNGSVLLGEPGRQTGDLFPDWIVLKGWTIETLEQRLYSRSRPIRLFRLTPHAHK